MRAVLPGKAQAKLQAVCTGYWDNRRLIAYITGNAFVILTGADTILQTIYDDDDSQLEAIVLDESAGKIATCAGSNIRIYKPYGQDEGVLKWSLQHSISIDDSGNDTAKTLSWGIAEELLVGSSWLTLFSTIDAPVVVWKQQLANPAKFANFSYDSAFIASSGKYDKFMKIWRRLSFGNDDTRFDFTYLPHPRTVTYIHWRKPFHIDQTIDNVLYTVCADNVLRIWAPTDVHSLQSLQLWGQVDLQESIQPRGLGESKASKLRFAFIIDGRDFTVATEHAMQERAASDSKEDHALAHLIEVANRNPEICVVLDEHGHLSAWGLENLYNFCNQSGGNLNVLVHHFDGRIEFFEADVADLFDPSPRSHRLKPKALWTGHSGAIKKIPTFLPVDPAGSPPVISGFLDTFARDIAISYTHSGLLRSWTARIDVEKEKVDWLQTCSVDTGISEPALASGSSIRKAALVNSSRSELTIWDVRGARLEYSQDYESQDTIQDLDWTSTPDDQSILAVGFRYRVVLLAQMRYDYLNKGPAWAAIREVNIRDLTPHPIGDSTWLGGGNFIVGAGNQLFVYDKEVDSSASNVIPPRKTPWDLFDIVSRLNGPLPVYHPQFLSQYILAGKNLLVQHILLALYKILKYYIEGEPIDSHLGMNVEDFYVSSEHAPSASKGIKSPFDGFSEDDEVETVTENVAAAITEKLTQIALPQLSRQEQIHLADIVECVAIVERQRRSMDDNAARFMLFFRQHVLRRGRANELALSWREINWAYHSNSQDILADMVSRQFHGRMLWKHARESGIFMWMTDANALLNLKSLLGMNIPKAISKNPIDCSLYYLALKKKAVLQGLWRMAAWNREQGATTRLLANNFAEKKWRTAAMKNAYALLGKRRFEYAAAFFLLADCLKDAVNVILSQLKDLQLAIAVTRVYEGEHGPVLKELLEEKVLPLAAQEGNRWLASWAFWMLHRRDMAVRALIAPVYTLLETPQSPDLQAKLFLTDDPALVVLYSQLRQKTLQTLRGASKVTPKVEWAFVLHNSRLYDLADLPLSGIGPAAVDKKDTGTGHGQTHKPPPTVFEEPEANSLLDSFGF
ncbi:hypothetical protein DID88_007995 [Monilinia fructigena]|uniref:RAVE complex protein Rav1 C-terminal domain-containing protein n=1 Tax=Monilinia fructigena TaxID=38457 RepID=A0A395J400_9HELO|nr:hypothetical protein DID88_007995 [Monilinia fructigena]